MRLAVLFFLSFIIVGKSFSQQDTTKSKAIIVQNANSQIYDIRTDSTLFLNGDVVLLQDSVLLYCDTARLVNNQVYAHGNVVVTEGDSIRLFADSIQYNGDSLMSYFWGDVVLEQGDNQLFTNYLQYDIDRDIGTYTDTALLRSKDYELKSKRGYYFTKTKTVDFYDKVDITGKDFLLVTDSLRYLTEQEKAIFLAPVNITNKDQKLYSRKGYYYLNNNNSKFYGNAQFQDSKRKASADTIWYNGVKKEVIFLGNAQVSSDQELGKADKISYAEKDKILTLTGNAYYKKEDQVITGSTIIYDDVKEQVRITGKSYLTKDQYIIQGDKVDYDKESGIAYLNGTASLTDTIEQLTVYGDHVIYHEKEEKIVTYNDTGKPLIEDVDGVDTTFISGDTLVHFKQISEIDTASMFQAYHHVEILTKDISGSCDSLIYDGLDSIITLFRSPVMFSDSTQFSSDTIRIHIQNKKVNHIDLRQNALIINTPDLIFFNQIAGKNGEVFFKQDSIERLDINEDAKSIYYLVDDDDGYIGVNKTESQDLSVIFENKGIRYIKYFVEPKKDLLPMEGTNHETLRVDGFFWNFNNRPRTRADLLK